jgi:outer membrane protein OmpA-like peptidoglycan-associated protein
MRTPWAIFVACVACNSGGVTTNTNPPVVSKPSPTVAQPVDVDSDHDGVPDACDYCPREPGYDRPDHPYGRGCPYIDSFGDSGEFLRVPIVFGKNQASTHVVLTDIATEMQKRSNHFFVVGHATADETDPEALALRRAQTIATALAAAGVDPSKLEVHSAGVVRPIYVPAANVDVVKSRRVELDIDRNYGRNQVWVDERKTIEPKALPDLCPH